MRRLAMACAVGAILLRASLASAHGPEMMLGSTASGSGALALAYDFTDEVVTTPSVSLGGMTLYTSIFPGIEWLQADDPADSLYALPVGTPFSLQLVSIDAGASVVINNKTTLSAPGQSALVATTTNIAGDHDHPQWQLLLPDGVQGNYSVSFQLTTTAKHFTSSVKS